MEVGGLRADVNVSVRRRTNAGIEAGSHSYHGISGLGQRTEIKNLSSFKAVEDAIIAERNRQIKVLESGGVIEGETRGWSLGSTETRKLRGKEGEVDYRYMPDPDLGPVIVSSELVDRLQQNLPTLPDDMLEVLTDSSKYMLTVKDAKTLITLDNAERLDYYLDVVENLRSLSSDLPKDIGRIAGNWVLHEIGGHFSKADVPWSADRVPSTSLARIIWYLVSTKINGRSAKQLLELIFNDDPRDIDTIVQEENMTLKQMSEDTYFNLAQRLITENPKMVEAIKQKGQKGKVMWFVGQMIRELGQDTQAEQAKRVLHQILDIPDDSKRNRQ
jgi:aspartyl-tRNA(Asn)/glutamyl-tRNA(Gln) amidotransferase subunit B